MRRRKPVTGAEVKDLDAFNASMPHEEIVMDNGRQRRRAVFDVSDDELLKNKMEEEESEDEDEDDDSDELELSDSASSLSMSIESHGSLESSTPITVPKKPREKKGGKEEAHRQRALSVSMFYEEGSIEVQETHAFESNPLSYNDTEEEDDKDFQKLSFTRTRKMSDAGGW